MFYFISLYIFPALERESKLKSDRVLALQEKNLHAVIQTPSEYFITFSIQSFIDINVFHYFLHSLYYIFNVYYIFNMYCMMSCIANYL